MPSYAPEHELDLIESCFTMRDLFSACVTRHRNYSYKQAPNCFYPSSSNCYLAYSQLFYPPFSPDEFDYNFASFVRSFKLYASMLYSTKQHAKRLCFFIGMYLTNTNAFSATCLGLLILLFALLILS